MPTGVFELASLPQTFFDLAHFFLVLEEEVGGFAVACNLSSERQVADMFEGGLEPVEIVSAILESPEVILCILQMISLIMVRDHIQWPPILRIISRNNTYNVRVWSHDHSHISRRDAPPPVVGNYAGYIVNPTIEIEA